MTNDKLEMNDLYGNPEYADVVSKLKQQLKETRAEVEDSDADYPHIAKVVATHWDGGEAEAVAISNRLAKQPPADKKARSPKQRNRRKLPCVRRGTE